METLALANNILRTLSSLVKDSAVPVAPGVNLKMHAAITIPTWQVPVLEVLVVCRGRVESGARVFVWKGNAEIARCMRNKQACMK